MLRYCHVLDAWGKTIIYSRHFMTFSEPNTNIHTFLNQFRITSSNYDPIPFRDMINKLLDGYTKKIEEFIHILQGKKNEFNSSRNNIHRNMSLFEERLFL